MDRLITGGIIKEGCLLISLAILRTFLAQGQEKEYVLKQEQEKLRKRELLRIAWPCDYVGIDL